MEAAAAAASRPCRVLEASEASPGLLRRLGAGWEAMVCLLGRSPRLRIRACYGRPPGWCGWSCLCEEGGTYEDRRLCRRRCIETEEGYLIVEEL